MKTVRDVLCAVHAMLRQGLHSNSFLPLAGVNSSGFLTLGGYMNYEVHHAVAVAKYIVIPGNELYKVVAETSFNPTIKDKRESIAFKFPGDNLVLRMDAL